MPAGGDLAGERFERVEIVSRAAWRAWLATHGAQKDSVWVVTFKKGADGPHVPYSDVVDEALCFGWVDSLPRKLDDRRSMVLVSPRKPTSAWSKVNKDKVARLIEAGRMAPPGLAAIERARANGAWERLDAIETLAEPDDLKAALAADPLAAGFFSRFPASSRRGILEWIVQARKAETRAARIAETVRLARDNIKANHPAGRNLGPKPQD